jgi:membrane associated rhomboid family serine protease
MRIPVRNTTSQHLANDWSLVLLAEGVDASVEVGSDGYSLSVWDADFERASALLDLYDSENPPPPPVEDVPDQAGGFEAAAATMAAMLLFFLVTGPRDPSLVWFERGSADAARILSGELWRTVTALTLHADLGHVLGNVFAGTLFLTALGRSLGPGLAIAMALVAGLGGNLLNALYHGTAHVAVGASTSVFGAVGLLSGHGVVRRGRIGARGHRRWTPFAAGLALLAMLGTSSRADLGAHLFGLFLGAGLGVAVALVVRRPPDTAQQWMLGAAALALVLTSWGFALD